MNNLIKKIAVPLSAVLTVLFILTLYFTIPNIPSVPETTGEVESFTIGSDITATRINDFEKLNRITKVNYIANEFVMDNSLDKSEIVDLTKPFEFAKKGTLIFIVMNLDPDNEDFKDQSKKLSDYLIGEYWHFTLSLPKIFCASNVYLGSNLVARHGEIENYNFIDYTTTYDIKTNAYSSKVERTEIDLKFYTRRHALNLYHTITVHYESSGTVYSGMQDCPLIGTEKNVKTALENSQNLLITLAVLSAVVFAVLIVLSFLKRTKSLISAIVLIFGIVLMLFPKFMLSQATRIPLFWEALSYSGAFLTLGGSLFELGRNFKKIPAKYIFAALMAIGGLLAVIYPFVTFKTAQGLLMAFTVIKAIGAAALLAFALLSAFCKDDKRPILETATASLIAAATFTSVFVPTVFPVYCNSMFYLCAVAVITMFISVFKVFKDTEKANAYLTANLHLEVERQVKDLKSVLTERDDLLRFISHDMKKPLQSSDVLINSLIEREKDEEQTKGLKIVKQNNSRVIENLSQIGSFARFNYIAEPSRICDLRELCDAVYDFHTPDCNANGIVLNNLVVKNYKVFVKQQGLKNAISNIIINAIEHANCTSITVSAKTEKDRIILSIADDGKGIDDGLDVFKAYVSEKSKTDGIGLYICKNIIETMNGTLTYESSANGTVFYISLLQA